MKGAFISVAYLSSPSRHGPINPKLPVFVAVPGALPTIGRDFALFAPAVEGVFVARDALTNLVGIEKHRAAPVLNVVDVGRPVRPEQFSHELRQLLNGGLQDRDAI